MARHTLAETSPHSLRSESWRTSSGYHWRIDSPARMSAHAHTCQIYLSPLSVRRSRDFRQLSFRWRKKTFVHLFFRFYLVMSSLSYVTKHDSLSLCPFFRSFFFFFLRRGRSLKLFAVRLSICLCICQYRRQFEGFFLFPSSILTNR